jgi:hypothetical protein
MSGPNPKIKIDPLFLALVLGFPKKVCHVPVGQLRERKILKKTGCFQPRAVPCRLADLNPSPKYYLYIVKLR